MALDRQCSCTIAAILNPDMTERLLWIASRMFRLMELGFSQ